VRIPTALIGCEVWRTSFDHQVRLLLVAPSPGGGHRVNAELVIESPFRLRDPTGTWHELEPGAGARLAPVLDLFQTTVTAVEVGDHGALTLGFAAGRQLFVAPDPQFESWQLAGVGVKGILVGPGGETGWR
jgi:hypothetical protein